MKDYERVETLYWANFTLADTIGVDEINKMFNTLFDECKGKGMYKYLTELAMVLNHKIFEWYYQNKTYSVLYENLYLQLRDYAHHNLKRKELDFYISITD